MLPQVAVIVVLPVLLEVARPVFFPIVAMLVSELVQFAAEVIVAVLASVKVPVALNCSVRPAATDGFVGDIERETSSAGTTVRVVLLLVLPQVVVIVVEPVPTGVARPECKPTVATARLELVQLAVPVRFCVAPLL
jgi:hypothetical protein